MTLYGPDLSNNNWNGTGEIAGWLDDCFHREGFAFMEHKVSEGSYYRDPFWPTVRDWCAANDVPCVGYHYVTTNDANAQAQTFVDNGGGSVAMLDFEANSGNIINFWAVADAFNAHGVRVILSYIPHWYWEEIGSPSLNGVPGLISSSYYERGTYAAREYADAGGDGGQGWNAYGGVSPVIWQFSDGGIIDGKSVDVNAFRGTEDDLRWLFGDQSNTGVFMALSDQEQADLLTAVRDIQTQLRGPNLSGWPQLGQNANGEDLTLIDAIANVEILLNEIKSKLGI